MGTVAKTVHGGRAKLVVDGKVLGIFTSVTYGVNYDAQPVYTLGRFSPQEIALTAQEPIAVQCSGFRYIDHGPHSAAKVPMLQDLLNHQDISLAILDRQTGKTILNVVGVRPTGYNATMTSKSLSEIQVHFLGLRQDDESGAQDESSGATTLP